MRDITVAITAASYHGNKGAAAMLQSSIKQLYARFGHSLNIILMSVYPRSDRALLPFDFIRVVNAAPERVVFFAFPLAILYRLLRWLPPVRWLLLKNKILKAYSKTDLVLDEAGISFVDSRGFVMNTYAFVTMAIPLLMGVKTVKYSQAMGSFRNTYNRTLAKIILPKLGLVCARGEITLKQLAEIGITKNVHLCADGAFSMPDDPLITRQVNELVGKEAFFSRPFVSLSLSSVVEARCRKLGINYIEVMAGFANRLIGQGYGVLIVANAIRPGSEKPRNNDLFVCEAVWQAIHEKDWVWWQNREMGPEEIRELIGRSRVLVASRFHAMIGGLEKQVPVLLVGWSHKYKEVLDMFGLGAWAADYSQLSTDLLGSKFDELLAHEDEIRQAIAANLPAVLESSRDNIRLIGDYIETDILPITKKVKLLDVDNAERYTGECLYCTKGYAVDERLRQESASGGMVTALLCSLLRQKKIDGAWVTRSCVRDGRLSYETFIATTEEEIQSCQSSIYMEMPLMRHLDVVEQFNGRVAVVLLPCQMKAFTMVLEKRPVLQNKVVLKLSLYCSGSHDSAATMIPLKKNKIGLDNASRFFFRRGHWRGYTVVRMADGTEKQLSYTKGICAYKNAYYFSQLRCMVCQDQYGRYADLGFGDIWLKQMKRVDIKHTSCTIHTEVGRDLYEAAVSNGDIVSSHLSKGDLIRSQKRALIFKYNLAEAKVSAFAKQGKALRLDDTLPCRWNHRLAWALARRNQAVSAKNPNRVERMPMWITYYYMCFIRVLLSF